MNILTNSEEHSASYKVTKTSIPINSLYSMYIMLIFHDGDYCSC